MLKIIDQERIKIRLENTEKELSKAMEDLNKNFNACLEWNASKIYILNEEKRFYLNILKEDKYLEYLIKQYINGVEYLPSANSTNQIKVLQESWKIEALKKAITFLTDLYDTREVLKVYYKDAK